MRSILIEVFNKDANGRVEVKTTINGPFEAFEIIGILETVKANHIEISSKPHGIRPKKKKSIV